MRAEYGQCNTCEGDTLMSATPIVTGTQPASLTSLEQELMALANRAGQKNRPPKERPVEIQGPVLVIRGK
jgi:hypothetical protein